MARMTVSGGAELSAMLEALGRDAEEIAKRGLYDGAGIIADAVRASADGIPVCQDNEWGSESHPRAGIREYEKNDLIGAFGVAVHRNEGGKITTSVGFHGYNSRGKANALIAASVERGTSFMLASPFVKPAVSASRSAARAAMIKTAEEEINKRTK